MNAFDLRVELLRVAVRNDLTAEAIVDRAKVFEAYVLSPSEAGVSFEAGEVDPPRKRRGRPPITKVGESLI